MRPAFALAACAFALFGAEALAQTGPRGINMARFAAPPSNNQVVVVQEGDGNAAAVVQRGRGHAAAIGQFGDDNAACIVQLGRNTQTTLIQEGEGQSTLVLRTPARQRVYEGAEADRRMRRACGIR